MDFNIFFEALIQAISPASWLWMILGLLIGVIFGAIPGLSGNLGIILFLPFTRSMPLAEAIIFLTCIFCGGEFGGSISAILIGTPGTNSATCTMLEGYPLAKQGHARKALVMALFASCVGGVLSSLCLLFMAPSLAKYTLEFGPPEYFAISLFGVSIIASLSGKSLAKGIFSGCLGIVLSIVGPDEVSGMMRFSFGNINLYRGLNLIALLTGFFAMGSIAEKVCDIMAEKGARKKVESIGLDENDVFTFKEILKYKWGLLYGSLIGIIIGIIPGTGAGIASFIAYNEARRTSKHPEEYGHGSYEGIAAVESANNGVTSASLIPLLTLGLPGSPSAAVLIGAFTMKGLTVGPMLFREQPVVMYTIMIALVIANVIMYAEGWWLSKVLANITKIPNDIMVPILLVICAAGAVSVNNSTFDLLVFVIAGIIAYFFAKLNVPVVPAVLGFVLGNTIDTNLRKGLVMTGGSFIEFISRPITMVVLILTVVVIILSFIKEISSGRKKEVFDNLMDQGDD